MHYILHFTTPKLPYACALGAIILYRFQVENHGEKNRTELEKTNEPQPDEPPPEADEELE